MTHKNQNDWMSSIKERFKAFPNLYYWLVDLISPVYPDRKYKKLLNSLSEDNIVINLGSGARKLSQSVINIDISPYKNVDVVASIFALPFPDNSIDGIINITVLEHISNPNTAVNEMCRVLKPDGLMFSVGFFKNGSLLFCPLIFHFYIDFFFCYLCF